METKTRRLSAADHEPRDIEGVLSRWKPAVDFLPVLGSNVVALRQFRKLRDGLEDLRLQNEFRSIAVVSPVSGEGKSYVAANLAVMLAKKRDARVVLIDGDLERGMLHLALGTTNEDGLAHHLGGGRRLSDIVQRGYGGHDGLVPALSKLSFVASGAGMDDVAGGDLDLLEATLSTLKSVYDWVIVDTPPLAAGRDAVTISRMCDRTLLVAREGVTRYDEAEGALSEIDNLLGVVMNGSVSR